MSSIARRQIGSVLVATAAVLLAVSGGAGALPGESPHASWTLSGSGGAYSGTATLPTSFPAVSFTSNSAAPATVPSGASAWMPPASPYGEAFGSTQGRPYLQIRPAANNSSSPSTTTFTFAEPTPTAGWGFYLSDVDAESVRVSATAPGGTAVPLAGLGFEGTFNACDASPRSSACSGVVVFDEPVASTDASSALLTGNGPDTQGASAWFRPTTPLETLTFTHTWITGIPTFSTSFSVVTRSITGTVTVDGAPLSGAELTLHNPSGDVIATTSSAADGTYSFPGNGPVDGYTVEVTPPEDLVVVGPSSRAADLAAADAAGVDFGLTVPVYDVPGTLTDPDGVPLADVPLSLIDEEGEVEQTTVTNDEGEFTFEDVPAGEYTLVVDDSSGYGPGNVPVSVPLAAGTRLSISVAPVAENPNELPATGGVHLELAACGAALVALGSAVLRLRRDRA